MISFVRASEQTFRTVCFRCPGSHGGPREQLISGRTDPSASSHHGPAPPHRPAMRRPATTRPWHVRVLDSTGSHKKHTEMFLFPVVGHNKAQPETRYRTQKMCVGRTECVGLDAHDVRWPGKCARSAPGAQTRGACRMHADARASASHHAKRGRPAGSGLSLSSPSRSVANGAANPVFRLAERPPQTQWLRVVHPVLGPRHAWRSLTYIRGENIFAH